MSVIERKNVPTTMTETYCANADCDGEGFYSARCKSEGHATEQITYVPAEQLQGAVDALRAAEEYLVRGSRIAEDAPVRAKVSAALAAIGGQPQ